MSGHGAPSLNAPPADALHVTVVAGMWHTEIAEGLVAGALRVLDAAGAITTVVKVPGSFELPVVTQAALRSGADAAVALGVIIRGDTPHFEYVAGECIKGLSQVSMDSGIPVAFGVLTVDSIEQAIERSGSKAGNKGEEAALSALEMISLLDNL